MNKPTNRLRLVQQRIEEACEAAGRSPSEVKLLAVSKRQPTEKLRALHKLGVDAFGENQLQEAVIKQQALEDLQLQWHFIGAIQSNKTRPISEQFDWVQSVDRERTLRRLSSQRPPEAGVLNICLQVDIDNEPQKGGASPDEILPLAAIAKSLTNIKLRGLMAIPRHSFDIDEQRDSFKRVREVFEQLKKAGYDVDTLSMGMSADLESAIFEGSTLVRVGTDIFGAHRNRGSTRQQQE